MSADCNVFLQEVWRLCGYGIYAVGPVISLLQVAGHDTCAYVAGQGSGKRREKDSLKLLTNKRRKRINKCKETRNIHPEQCKSFKEGKEWRRSANG